MNPFLTCTLYSSQLVMRNCLRSCSFAQLTKTSQLFWLSIKTYLLWADLESVWRRHNSLKNQLRAVWPINNLNPSYGKKKVHQFIHSSVKGLLLASVPSMIKSWEKWSSVIQSMLLCWTHGTCGLCKPAEKEKEISVNSCFDI